MNHLNEQPAISADMADEQESKALVQSHLQELTAQLQTLEQNGDALERAYLLLEIAHANITLEQNQDAWVHAKTAFDTFLQQQHWEAAVGACNILFQSEQPGSLPALGQGVWLAVTFPMDPELSIVMLEHIVDETPNDSDGGAVAAATACYIADLRSEGKTREKMQFFTNQLLGKVARRHSNIEDQGSFDAWISRLELDMPEAFLGRLRQVIEVLVQDDWWFERDQLRNLLPEDEAA
ncbi:hypothetical protein [Candidatus Venteria ishoeyi]|uniref:Uncharacterized protein n=1 Tax=Candidatus Venteria ishoeyi TaxID=1899563 RepID=A0A1H6FA93_9GAMM|nr:hypothetical protein [Candidatus Venteria ishoeyi]MDM8548246.1 hypothetical protein [Candidatus Venteria ishoeyi]SEH06219.1 Uncharacterised protein [Candidatus Venteria ishoeyi]